MHNRICYASLGWRTEGPWLTANFVWHTRVWGISILGIASVSACLQCTVPVSGCLPSWNTKNRVNGTKNEKLPEFGRQPGIMLPIAVKAEWICTNSSQWTWEHERYEVTVTVKPMVKGVTMAAWPIYQHWTLVWWGREAHKKAGQHDHEYNFIFVPERICSKDKKAWMN